MANKNNDPAILFFISDWLASTAGMSADCRGWYINLLCHNHDKGELPDDIEQLANLANVRFSDFKRFEKGFASELSKKFVKTDSGGLTNPKLESIMLSRNTFKEKRAKAGKIGVIVRASKGVSKNINELEHLKDNYEHFEDVIGDKQMLQQEIKQVLKLYRNGNRNRNGNGNRNGTEDKINLLAIDFEDFWKAYDKKVGSRVKIENKWNKLSIEEQEAIMSHIPKYKYSQPDKQFRKNPETYLNNRAWEDEIVASTNGMAVGQKITSEHEKERNY